MGRQVKVKTEQLLPLIREGCTYDEIAERLDVSKSAVSRAMKRVTPEEVAHYELDYFLANEKEISSRHRMLLSKLIEKKLAAIDPQRLTVAELKKLHDMAKEMWEKQRTEDGLATGFIGVGHKMDPKQVEDMKEIARTLSGNIVKDSVQKQLEHVEIIDVEAEGN